MSNAMSRYKFTKITTFSICLLLNGLIYPINGVAEEKQDPSETITGAGAHFAWVIFDALKDELEETSGKNIALFGKNSNLGMGV